LGGVVEGVGKELTGLANKSKETAMRGVNLLADEDGGEENEDEEDEEDKPVRRKKRGQTLDDQLLDTEAEMRQAFNDDDLLSRMDIEETMAEVTFGEMSEEQLERERLQRYKFQRMGDGDKIQMSTEGLSQDLKPVTLPYESLECVFNNQNLWVQRNHTDPALITYDFDDKSQWDAFLEPRMKSNGLPQPFYLPKRLASKPPADRLKAMEHQILGELTLQIKYSRPGLSTIINKSAELEDTLQRGLELQEMCKIGDEAAKKELDSWTKEAKSKMPPGSTFTGRVINYSYTDAKRIRKHLLSSTDYASRQDDGTQFALAVKCFGFHGGVVSVWVYFGIIDTDLLS